ncbi:hypothetical protein [Sphingomonas sp.]|uniref:hypothetical protein n=1 Tax=Sphingomonas sp. TaxID=28214 RepID=UPI001D36D9D9|nr:hypothetical protein [Sphingomonas sp.]MBX9797359.1 hypothetical protein [Sphingomonas sp.]
MSFGKFLAVTAAALMAVAPVAAAAQSTNPAAGLSIAPAAKTAIAPAPAGKKSRFGQGGLIAGVVVAVGLSIAALVVALDSRNNNPVSR